MYRLIDLFSGCGGLTQGFAKGQVGDRFAPVWAIDADPAAAATYADNFGPHILVGDIERIIEDPGTRIPSADIVIGGPPCQGFSLLNKQRANDVRRTLWHPFLKIVERCGAKVFLIENVPGLLKSPEMDEIVTEADELGFHVMADVINAADFGVPQTRRRAVVIGWAKGAQHKPKFPTTSHARKIEGTNKKRWRTVRDVISDLAPPEGTNIRSVPSPYDLHFGRNPTEVSRLRYSLIPEGGNRFNLQEKAPHLTPRCWLEKPTGSTDLFGRLWWDQPAVTIRTEFFKPEKGRYLHPEQDRAISHREAARLMGFPDEFKFTGTKTEVARQIGNAVPPQVAEAFAIALVDFLDANREITQISAQAA